MEQPVLPVAPQVEQQEAEQPLDGREQARARHQAGRLSQGKRIHADRNQQRREEVTREEQPDVARGAPSEANGRCRNAPTRSNANRAAAVQAKRIR